jgi:hypothetical protein
MLIALHNGTNYSAEKGTRELPTGDEIRWDAGMALIRAVSRQSLHHAIPQLRGEASALRPDLRSSDYY